jgi:hypothetical protein
MIEEAQILHQGSGGQKQTMNLKVCNRAVLYIVDML